MLWDYHIWLLLCWGMFLLCLFSRGFFLIIINGYWILSKAFSASVEIIIWFLSLNLLIWCITLVDSWILKNSCIPEIKPTWSWCMTFLICCWILFARILLRNFAFMFISDVGLQLSFSSLVVIARTSKTTLNNSSESGKSCLVPDLRGDAFSFSPLRIMFAVGLSSMAFTEVGSFYAHFLGSLNHK